MVAVPLAAWFNGLALGMEGVTGPSAMMIRNLKVSYGKRSQADYC